ncbi:hypothetical protein FHX77_000256 [Bifidobacterium commune]|nr:hypothetical protein [Bifidobacterium commune]
MARGLKGLTIWDLVFLADHVCRGNLRGHGVAWVERRDRSVPWCDIETFIGMVVTDLCYSYVDHPVVWRYEVGSGKRTPSEMRTQVAEPFRSVQEGFQACSTIARKNCRTRSSDMQLLLRFGRY